MLHFLPVAGSWRCKQGIHQGHQVTWQRWVFMASFLIHDHHTRQSAGGGDGEIFKPPANPKVTHLCPLSPTAPLYPFLSATLAPPWTTDTGQCTVPAPHPSLLWPIVYSVKSSHRQVFYHSGSCRDLLLFLSHAQACGRCLVWVLNMFHLSHDDVVLKCCNIC